MVPEPVKALVRPPLVRARAARRRWKNRPFTRLMRKHEVPSHGLPEVSILLPTYNRLRMLSECLTSLFQETPGDNFEVLVWDNASTDGTKEYLDQLAHQHPALRVFHSPTNVGLNAVARSVKLARGFYLVVLDEDVVRFPPDWLSRMLQAFRRVPHAGFLAANVVQDDLTQGAKYPPKDYKAVEYDGSVLEMGPTGGWCTMTSLEVLSRVGNFISRPDRVFYCHDGDFSDRCQQAGFTVGIVQDVVVYHAAGILANEAYGYLDVLRQKWSEDPEFAYLVSTLDRHVEERGGTAGAS
jgi:GT2 family glycosyltransferase